MSEHHLVRLARVEWDVGHLQGAVQAMASRETERDGRVSRLAQRVTTLQGKVIVLDKRLTVSIEWGKRLLALALAISGALHLLPEPIRSALLGLK